MSLAWFNGLLIVWSGIALLSFGSLLWKPAPYGRYFEPGWGRALNPRLGWILMETPAALILPVFFLASPRKGDPVLWAFTLVWLLHYVHRAWIYPFRKTAGRAMPLGLALCAVAFNAFNGSFNGGWLFHLGPVYPSDWLRSPQFLAGLAVFAAGFAINVTADTALIRLRQNSDRYVIPRGGLFRWISCPNYLGEILEWCGWAILTWSWAGLSFAIWTAANLVPRAISHHRYYRKHLKGYPASRKAILPFVY
jgi:3-oxo-5-alpha-steroid 4-dehydrogenase 1